MESIDEDKGCDVDLWFLRCRGSDLYENIKDLIDGGIEGLIMGE
ncbi:hypothetical protein [Staphylococcus aureus]|nr:hypothetical protein [Staphylococcus aureus]